MADKIGITLELEGERQFQNAVKNCNTELKNMQSALKLATQEAEGQERSLETLERKEKALADAIDSSVRKEKTLAEIVEKVKKKRDEAKKALDDARKAEGDNTEAVKKAEQAYQSAENSVNKWETQLNNAKATTAKMRNELDSTQGEMREFERGAEDAADAGEDLSKKTGKAADAVDAMATVFISSGVAGKLKDVADGLLECVEAADKFEVAMKKVTTIADTSVVSAEDLENAIMQQSSAMAVSAEDYAEATYQAISASIDTADAVDFVANATKLSEAGFTDATAATDILTTALNAYGLQASEASRISDILVTTQNLGKTSVDQLAQSMGNVLPVASTYNVSMEDVASAYVELTRNGINTANATTDLRAMLSELGDSSKDVAQILLEKTGKSFSQLMDEGASLGDVIDILSDSVNGDKDAFAELWASARTSGISALTLLNRGTDDYNKVLKNMKNSTGAVDTAFKKMTSTSEYTARRFKNSVNNMKIAIGKQLSPALTNLQGTFADMIEKATEWIKENPGVVKAFTAIAVALGVITGAVVAYQVAIKLADLLTKAFTATNPWLLLATAIAGVVAALAVLTDGFKQPETALTRTRDAIADVDAAQAELNEKLADAKSEFDQTAGGIEAQAQNAEFLHGKLMDLINSGDRTAETQAKIATYVERLNALYPDLNLQYDKQTNSLNMTNAELSKYIEQTRQAAMLDAYKTRIAKESEALLAAQEKLTQAEKEYKTATQENEAVSIKVASANRKMTDAVNRHNKAVEEYDRVMADVNSADEERIRVTNEMQEAEIARNEATDEYNRIVDENRDVLEGITKAQEDYKQKTEEANNEIATANENLDRLIGEQNELADTMEGATAAAEANTGAMQANADSLWLSENAAQRVSQSYQAASDTVQLMAATVAERTLAMSDAINQAVDTSVQAFKDLNEDGTTSISEMITSMQNQIANVQQWEQNLATLIRYGVSEDIVQSFAQMGIASADTVAGMVAELDTLSATAPAQSEELVGQLNQVWGEQLDLAAGVNDEAKGLTTAIAEQTAGGEEALKQLGIDLKESAYDSMGFVNEGFLNGIKDGQDALNAAMEESGSEGMEAANEGLGVSSPSWKAEQSARFVISGFNKGLSGGKGSLLAVARALANQTMQALQLDQGTAQAFGYNASHALAIGIMSGRSAVINAATSVAQSAIRATQQALDIHSPSRVFEELGTLTGEGFTSGLHQQAAAIASEMRMVMQAPDIRVPDYSRHETFEIPVVNVYVGNRQLTTAMADAVTKEISAAQQAGYRGARA